ncbi:MAG: hypothetical protein JNN20_09960 [Betaproteobacteria bacterium]|nr:hypothetical protein [Betaproteobacteria bacterium]
MSDEERLREALKLLAAELTANNENDLGRMVSESASDSGRALHEFLRSNELWGGAGSIADQAGMSTERAEGRRNIERALINLGELQMSLGINNQRTASWVEAFKSWADAGI